MKSIFIYIFILTFFCCSDKREDMLFQYVRSEYQEDLEIQPFSSGVKAQYIHMEQMLNKKYVSNLAVLMNSRFDRQLEVFENNELGFWKCYMNMLSWLFQSKQSWDDEMVVLSNKYFNSLDDQQEQYELFLQYSRKVKELRSQFKKENNLPFYKQLDLPIQDVSLGFWKGHTRNNIIIELGTELFSWFLGFIILQVVLLIFDGVSSGAGCIIHLVVAFICIIASFIMTTVNDNKLIDSLKLQHKESTDYDYNVIFDSLSLNTIHFYEIN